jgi:O-methyltransferase involved in polyketide biosynthesis
MPAKERSTNIVSSFLDYQWINQIDKTDHVLFIAAGVLYYFEEDKIRSFFNKIADVFKGSEFIFDAASPLGVKMANKTVLKTSGMDNSVLLKWGLRNSSAIESWNSSIEIVDDYAVFKHFKRKTDFKNKIMLSIFDSFKSMFMVQLRFKR